MHIRVFHLDFILSITCPSVGTWLDVWVLFFGVVNV